MKLFWVITADHTEDWFIVAKSRKAAEELHETGEGFDPGEAKAQEVIKIPKEMSPEPGWPSNELLLKLGAIFICESPRVVEINGKRYCEGMEGSYIDEVRGNKVKDPGGVEKKTIH